MEAALKDLFKGGSVEETWAEADLGGPRPVDDDVAAAPDEEAIKNAEVVIEFEAPDTRSGTRTRKLSTMSLPGDKKRRKTKLDEYVCCVMYQMYSSLVAYGVAMFIRAYLLMIK